MPTELKALLSTQEESLGVSPFPKNTAEVQAYYVHGSRMQSLYPSSGRTAYATATPQHDNRSACLALTHIDYCVPSLATSSLTAKLLEDANMEDNHAFAYAMQKLRLGGTH